MMAVIPFLSLFFSLCVCYRAFTLVPLWRTLTEREERPTTARSTNAWLNNLSNNLPDNTLHANSFANIYHSPASLLHGRAASTEQIQRARNIVEQAQIEAGVRNAYLLSHPRLNSHIPHAAINKALDAHLYPQRINATVAKAAAIVAEADALESSLSGTLTKRYTIDRKYASYVNGTTFSSDHLRKRAANFWMENEAIHTGSVPFGSDPNYKVFRNVRKYGAVGDGKTDDTAAINKAISDGNRCGSGCATSSVKGALVYFPKGTYLISSPIIAMYNTQLVGNPNDIPILKAAKSFVGLGLITSDVYIPQAWGDEWYINQSNFLRQVRNFLIDIEDMPRQLDKPCGIHWQVAQGTSLQNIQFHASTVTGTKQIGIFAENGSGGFMSELTFYGGAVGIQCGNQQFTSRSLTFIKTSTAIDLLWDWGWIWKDIVFSDCSFGIRANGTDVGGSLQVMESRFEGCSTAGIYIGSPVGTKSSQTMYLTLENVSFSRTPKAILDVTANLVVPTTGDTTFQSWARGNVYDKKHPGGYYSTGESLSQVPQKPKSLLASNETYFQRGKPQYGDIDVGSFLLARSEAKGDGKTDDTKSINSLLLRAAAANKPLFFAAGSYMVSDTIYIPTGSRIVGECWSQLVAMGAGFERVDKPRPMIQVGKEGEHGIVEIQDMLFTAHGAKPGLTLVEWNMHESTQGSAAMWDSHFRIGGALGTGMQKSECPAGNTRDECIGAALMLHLTSSSSAYLENIWVWTADHDMDDNNSTMISVFTGRGVLIQSKGPSWLYATSSEHSVLYQYQVWNGANIFMCMIQTESPYYPPTPKAPSPFQKSIGMFGGDLNFQECDKTKTAGCAVSWALLILGSKNIYVVGAGLYSWFTSFNEDCVKTSNCQTNLVYIELSDDIWVYNLYTIGATNMIAQKLPVLAQDNMNQKAYPFVATISAYLATAASGVFHEIEVNITSGSSCTQIQPEQLKSSMWDRLNATAQLAEFYANLPKVNDKVTNFSLSFANPLGIGQSFMPSINHPIMGISCNNLENPGAPKSGFQYVVLRSMANLNLYLFNLYQGVESAVADLALLQTSIQTTFYPANDVGNLLANEILNALAAVILAVSALAGGPEIVATANLVAGGIVALELLLSDPKGDGNTANLITVEKIISSSGDAAKSFYENLNTELLWNYVTSARVGNGARNYTLLDAFAKGQWLDFRNIPILTTDTSLDPVTPTVLTLNFESLFAAVLVNNVWKAQNVYLMCFPMTETEYNGLTVKAGTNDFRLRHFYKSRYGRNETLGCYFQSAISKVILGVSYPYPINPNGWGSIGNSTGKFKFTPHDMIEGSVDSHYLGGFLYNPSTASQLSGLLADPRAYTKAQNWPGIFTIPICRLTTAEEKKTSAKDFASYLEEPNNIVQFPSFCFCYQTLDQFGVHITKVIGISQWIKQCTSSDNHHCKRQDLFRFADGQMDDVGKRAIMERCGPSPPERNATGEVVL